MSINGVSAYLNSLNKYGSVLGLDNMRALLSKLDNPQDRLKIIHVTGTNGKGSTCAFLSSILKEAGYKVGMYNSPAVICDYDQYKIDCEIINKDIFEKAVAKVKDCADSLNKEGIFPTRFEIETAAAFWIFEKEKADIAIIETGLGGKDDATCVINNAILHIITSISEDHLGILGDDILQIADNKSHIIKSSAPTVVFKSNDAVFEIIKNRCERFDSLLYYVENGADDIPALKGSYQAMNASLAVKAAQVLKTLGYNITDENILNGINNFYIPFRFEKIHDDPVMIADGAHNPDGAKRLIETLKSLYNGHDFIFIAGIFKDKDYEKICEITGKTAKKVYAVCNDKSERSLDAETLANCLKKYNDNVALCGTIEETINSAVTYAKENGNTIVVMFGSLSWLYRAKAYITDSIDK